MLGLIRKDLTLILSDRRQRIFLFLVMPLFSLSLDMEGDDSLYFLLLIIVTHLLILTPFFHDRANKSSNILVSLPITRRKIVIAKYIGVFISLIISLAYVGIYLWIIKLIGLGNVDYFNWAIIKQVLPYILFSSSLIIFTSLILSTRLAPLINMLIYMLVVISSYSFAEGSLASSLNSLALGFMGKGRCFPLVALGVFCLSMFISLFLYERKDL